MSDKFAYLRFHTSRIILGVTTSFITPHCGLILFFLSVYVIYCDNVKKMQSQS